MKKNYTGSGYITKKYLVSNETYKYFWSLTDDIIFLGDTEKEQLANRKKYHKFLGHVFASLCTIDLRR